MPQYIVRQVRETRIETDNIDQANYVGNTLLNGEPRDELAGSDNWTIIEEPQIKVFVVEED